MKNTNSFSSLEAPKSIWTQIKESFSWIGEMPASEKIFWSYVIFLLFSVSFLFVDAMVSASLFSADSTTVPIFSGEGLQGGSKIVEKNVKDLGIIESGSLSETIIFIVKWVLVFSGILAFIAFLWAGLLYITSFAKEDNNETAKKVMISAAIGLIIILLSWVIVDFLTTFDL